jgi:hypothetical protein
MHNEATTTTYPDTAAEIRRGLVEKCREQIAAHAEDPTGEKMHVACGRLVDDLNRDAPIPAPLQVVNKPALVDSLAAGMAAAEEDEEQTERWDGLD